MFLRPGLVSENQCSYIGNSHWKVSVRSIHRKAVQYSPIKVSVVLLRFFPTIKARVCNLKYKVKHVIVSQYLPQE